MAELECKKGENGLWGYVDSDDNWVIQPQFDDAWDFEEGLGRVELNGKQGFVKPDGSFLIEPVFEFAWDFSDGLSYFRIEDESGNTKDGVLKTDGTFFIEPIYDKIDYYIDDKGSSCNGLKIKDGLIHVIVGKGDTRKEGWMREDGSLLLAPDMYTYCGPFVNGFCEIWSIDNKKYGAFSREGQVVAVPQFDSVTFVGNGAIIVKNDDKYGLMNKAGELVLPIEYQVMSGVGEGLVKFRTFDSDKYGIASADGILKEPQYDKVGDFSDEALLVRINDLYGYLKPDGSYLFEPQFNEASSLSEGKSVVYQGRRRGIAYADGKLDFEKAIFCKQGDNGKYGFVDENGNWVVEPKYKGTWDSHEGLAVFMNDEDLCGFVDTEGKVVIEPKYVAVTNFYDGYAAGDNGDEGVVISKDGSDYEIDWGCCIDEMDIDEEPGSSLTVYGPKGGISIYLDERDSRGRTWDQILDILIEELHEDDEDDEDDWDDDDWDEDEEDEDDWDEDDWDEDEEDEDED